MAEVLPGRVGEVKIALGNIIPPGFISISDGTEVSRTQYSELWEWASANTTVLTDANWQNELSANGSVSKFSSGNGSSTFRLPKIIGIIAGTSLSSNTTFTKATYSNVHYHAIGSWSTNNGTWGWLNYTNATYPTGSTGIGWNGRGDNWGPGSGNPPTKGQCITSNEMYTTNNPATASSPRPATVNFTLCIRYTAGLQETATKITSAQVMEAAQELTEAVNVVSDTYAQDTLLEPTGYSITKDGLVSEWGTTPIGKLKGEIVFPVALADSTTPFNISTTLVEPTTMSGSVAVTAWTNKGCSYECSKLAVDSYVMWSIQGRV